MLRRVSATARPAEAGQTDGKSPIRREAAGRVKRDDPIKKRFPLNLRPQSHILAGQASGGV